MHLIPVVLLNLLSAGVLFWIGSVLGKKAASRMTCGWLVRVSLVLAAPGLLFVLYYTHLLDNAAWFYSFRVMPFTEFLAGGIGLVADF